MVEGEGCRNGRNSRSVFLSVALAHGLDRREKKKDCSSLFSFLSRCLPGKSPSLSFGLGPKLKRMWSGTGMLFVVWGAKGNGLRVEEVECARELSVRMEKRVLAE